MTKTVYYDIRVGSVEFPHGGIMEIILDVQKMRDLAPPSIATNTAIMQHWLRDQLTEMQQIVATLQPGDLFFHHEAIRVRYYPPRDEEGWGLRDYILERRYKLLPVSGEDLLAFVNMPTYGQHQAGGRGTDNRAANAAWYERVIGRLVDPLPVDAVSHGVHADISRGIFLWVFEHPSWPAIDSGQELPMLPLKPNAQVPLAFPLPVPERRFLNVAFSEEVFSMFNARFDPDEPELPTHDPETGEELPHVGWTNGYGPILTRWRGEGIENDIFPTDACCLSVHHVYSRQCAEALFYHPSFPLIPFGAEIPTVSARLDFTGADYAAAQITTAAQWNKERRRW